MYFVVVVSYYQEAADHLIGLVNEHLPPLLDKVIALMEFMKEHTDHNVHASQFGRDMQAALEANPGYVRSFFMRDSLRTQIKHLLKTAPAPAYKKELQSALTSACAECDIESNYASPGRFDFVLPYFLDRAPWLELIEPTLLAVIEGSPEAALVTIHAVTETIVADLLPKPSRTSMLVTYCGLVRFIFDQCYSRQVVLFEPQATNAEFLLKCERFCQRTVRSLNVPERVRARYPSHMRVPSLFREKQVSAIEKLAVLTNPIDMMRVVHAARLMITHYFGGTGPPLEFKDVTVLMLALISVNPPPNAVSIARFLRHWAAIKMMEEIGKTAELFVAAVEYIFTHEALDDENAEETEGG
jgi:hypothetical protein